jgi:serine/threonine-protein kinase PknK
MASPSQTPLASADLIAGRYQVVRELGAGASGRVLLVLDRTQADAPRALKLVPADAEERVRSEFALLAKIRHPNLARAYELVRDPAGFAAWSPRAAIGLVSAFVPGETVDRAARRHANTPARALVFALRVLDRCARALAALHAHGFVHGDVKPLNVLVDADAGALGLIDLGLARPPGFESTLSGTPRYMAPELWRGEVSLASDVFALGVLISGLLADPQRIEPEPRSSSEHLARALQPRAAGPSWSPPALRDLLVRMCAPDRAARIASGRELLEALTRLSELLEPALARELSGESASARTAEERASAVAQLPLIGQSAALAALQQALHRPEAGGLIAVVGPAGAGRSRLIRDAVFALQTEYASAPEIIPSYRLLARLPELVEAGPGVLHLQDADALDLGQARSLLRAAGLAGQACFIVLERSLALQAADVIEVALGPLDASGVHELLQAALPEQNVPAALVREASLVSGGLAARLCRLLASGFLAGEDMAIPGRLRAQVDGSAAGTPAVPARARALLELLAVAGGSLPVPIALRCIDAAELAEATQALSTLGLGSRGPDGRLALRPDVTSAVVQQLTAAERSALAARISPVDLDLRAGAHLASAGASADAPAAWQLAIEAALRAGAPARADELAGEALTLLGGLPRALVLLRAEALRALGRYTEATALLAPLEGSEATLARAELLRLRGEPAAARALCEDLLAAPRASPLMAAEALLARLLLDAGELEACRRHALVACQAEDDPAALRGNEVRALLALREGQLTAAKAALQTGFALARRRGALAAEARLCAVDGAIDRSAGELSAAARSFWRAHELAQAQGEYHAAASFLVNLGTAQLDAGELGPALRSLRAGSSCLARLGREGDLARALSNLVLAAQLIGDFERALSLGASAREAALRSDDPCAHAFALLCCAELLLERARHDEARALLADLPDLNGLAPLDHAIALARLSALSSGLGQLSSARQQLSAAEELLPAASAARAECALARAALAKASGDDAGALEHAEHALTEAQRRGEFAVLVLALLAAASAAERSGNAVLARARFAELRSLLDAAALTLTAAERALLRGVPAYRAALTALPTSGAAPLQQDQRVRQLAAIVKRLAAETRLPRLYELVLESAIQLSGAETGLLLRRDLSDKLRVRAARSVGTVVPAAQWSQSIVARVLSSGQPLSTVDAAQDARLFNASSVHALALRSVLALPIRLDGAVVGLIYLEDRLRPFAFAEAELALLSDFSELAALAISGLERLRRERRAVRRLSLAQTRLARQLEAQALELSSWKLAQARAGDETGIVAHSEPMREALAMALRVARSDVPVLIRGESGTGKELVARAIHAHSPRRGRPFVSESCSAIPEALLESALFGHVKGAFTGADRRRVGLFEAADGGTLLLDEIGEMTPTMQARLLRVLQEGEVRPLGGERTVRVNVRVLAATHRDLEAMVAAGSFREDLFYRLAVVNLIIPPLRDRSDDILPLVEHFMQKHAKGRSLRLERRALDRLLTQSWPGNVRQLENAVRRALVLGGDVLREEHFAAPPRARDAEPLGELHLRTQIDELERRLIRRALELAKGNQTRAAELLGVSRFGLQKMTKRLQRSD